MTTPSVWWYGASGAKYTFELFSLAGLVYRDVAGVYVPCKNMTLDNGSGYYHALYVGETDSFVDRLDTNGSGHDGFKCALAHGATHIGLMMCVERSKRLSIETDLRHALDPECNRQAVPHSLTGLLYLKG